MRPQKPNLFRTTGPLVLISLLLSCAQPDPSDSFQTDTDKPAPPPSAPEQPHNSEEPTPPPPQAVPPQPISLELDIAQLTAQGCLDLPLTIQNLKSLPETAVLRRHTSSTAMSPLDNQDEHLRRNFIAEVAFGRFLYLEQTPEAGTRFLPEMKQNGCQSIEMKYEVSGNKVFTIQPSSEAGRLHLIDEDKTEYVFHLKGSKELEIERTETVIDRCPQYKKAQARTNETLTWSYPEELTTKPILISRAYLNRISDAVSEMPASLSSLVTHATSDIIPATAEDLTQLTLSRLSTEIGRAHV